MRSTMLRGVALAIPIIALAAASALAQTKPNAGKHDTAKGAAAGAVIGHEVGHGHALAGAGIGAAVGHHEKKKAQSGQ